jgi:hypothetical protein
MSHWAPGAEGAGRRRPLEDEALLVGGDALLVLDLCPHGVDGVGGLNFKGEYLASQGQDENNTAWSRPAPHQQTQRGVCADSVVGEGAAILQRPAHDDALLVMRIALFVLDHGFDGADGIGGLHFKLQGFVCYVTVDA